MRPEIGDFISIPAWEVFGMVMDVKTADIGSDEAIQVLLQHHPDQPASRWKTYRLEPDEFTIE